MSAASRRMSASVRLSGPRASSRTINHSRRTDASRRFRHTCAAMICPSRRTSTVASRPSAPHLSHALTSARRGDRSASPISTTKSPTVTPLGVPATTASSHAAGGGCPVTPDPTSPAVARDLPVCRPSDVFLPRLEQHPRRCVRLVLDTPSATRQEHVRVARLRCRQEGLSTQQAPGVVATRPSTNLRPTHQPMMRRRCHLSPGLRHAHSCPRRPGDFGRSASRR